MRPQQHGFRVPIPGAAAWTTGAVIIGHGERLVRIGGLTPGLAHNFRAVNVGAMESTPMFLNNLIAPGDTTTPATPSTPTIQGQHLRQVTIATVAGTELDLSMVEFQIRTATGGSGTLVASGSAPAVKGGTTTKTLTVPATTPYGVTRFARARAKDHTGNPTDPTVGWSASTSFVLARAATDDYSDGSTTGPKLGTDSVSAQKILLGSRTAAFGPIAAGDATSVSVIHNLGVPALAIPESGVNGVGISVITNGTLATLLFVALRGSEWVK